MISDDTHFVINYQASRSGRVCTSRSRWQAGESWMQFLKWMMYWNCLVSRALWFRTVWLLDIKKSHIPTSLRESERESGPANSPALISRFLALLNLRAVAASLTNDHESNDEHFGFAAAAFGLWIWWKWISAWGSHGREKGRCWRLWISFNIILSQPDLVQWKPSQLRKNLSKKGNKA